MDKKELKDKIDELRSTAKMELACTIREIMREHNVQKKELGWPIVFNNSSLVDIVEVGSGDTDIPVLVINVGVGYKEPHKVSALDNCVSIELLSEHCDWVEQRTEWLRRHLCGKVQISVRRRNYC